MELVLADGSAGVAAGTPGRGIDAIPTVASRPGSSAAAVGASDERPAAYSQLLSKSENPRTFCLTFGKEIEPDIFRPHSL